jgi:hypothetical protein
MNELKEKMVQDDSSEKHLRRIAENTFVLALDGDVDFNPEAVSRLIDRMQKDPLVGAACGRIHPIGSGKFLKGCCEKENYKFIKKKNVVYFVEILFQMFQIFVSS